MNKKLNKENPPLLARCGDGEHHLYKDDGSYIMPHGICGETGAVMWWPVDIAEGEKGEAVAICRRDLSDEMLALFD